jgi:hypothetical protein
LYLDPKIINKPNQADAISKLKVNISHLKPVSALKMPSFQVKPTHSEVILWLAGQGHDSLT